MIDNKLDDKNIKLTAEQTAGLEEYQLRLSNLLSEIVNHTKILKVTQKDCDKAVKERAYQEELLTQIAPKVVEKQTQLDALNGEISNATTTLSKLQAEIGIKTAEQAKKDSEFENRENYVKSEEEKLQIHQQMVTKLTTEKEQAENIFNQKVAKLKEVIALF